MATRPKSKPVRQVSSPPPPRNLRPWALGAFTALVTATPLIPSESVAELGAGLFLNLLWLLLLATWAVMAAMQGEAKVRAGATLAAIVMFVALVGVSGWLAAEGNPRATINSVWQWSSFAVVFFLARQWVVTPCEQRAVVVVMLALAAGLAGLGYYQFFISQPQARAFFEQNPEQALREANLPPDADPQVLELFRNRVSSVEPLATFALTNSLAGFLTPWLVLAAGIGFSLGRQTLPRRLRAAAGVALVLAAIGGCFFLTKSRSAWGAALCGIILAGHYGRTGDVRRGWRAPLVVIAGLLLLFLGAVLMGGLDVEVWSEAPKSLLYRFEYWQATAALIRDHPWWGVGVGNFQTHYTAYKLPQASETVADPHNFLLEVWASSGALALAALLAFAGLAAWRLRPAAGAEIAEPSDGAPGGPAAPDAAAASSSPVYAVYLGGLAGLLLAFPLGLAAQFPVAPALLVAGAPLAVACVALLHPWTLDGRLPLSLVLAAVAAMLINLLAAGGFGFASVATSLWLLVALALNLGERRPPLHTMPRPVALGVLAGSLGLVAAFYATAYRPALASAAAMAEGMELASRGRASLAEERFHAAAEADPWSRFPWESLLSLHAQEWLASGSPQARREFESAWREAVARNRNSYGLWKSIGDLYLAAYQRRQQPEDLQAAIQAHSRAVALYPARAPLRVELAWRLHLAGQDEQAATMAADALRLDQQNPHREQKLAAFPAPDGAEATNLEQLARNMRKLEGP